MARFREGEVEWYAFTDLPGIHAAWRAAGGQKQLVSTAGQVLVTLQPPSELIIQGRTYEWRREGRRTRSHRTPRDLVDPMTGQQLLRIKNRPEGRRLFGPVETPTHRYTFPVQGERQRFATMSAVDESGYTAFRFRE